MTSHASVAEYNLSGPRSEMTRSDRNSKNAKRTFNRATRRASRFELAVYVTYYGDPDGAD